ncbi:hypothetical protein [Ruegeria marina]|uniref:MetA-pathway of phenol degradation n=1 Tax=Ruegeria marina TaxID=639004 RepID=A0A1G6XBX2_9RHOB|nr:hypothetical protein [Ruegeria marina]SDD75572.1 hypothetical protein SAMN04488239_11036 [Ruegeria marina]
MVMNFRAFWIVLLSVFAAHPGHAQPRPGWTPIVDGLVLYQDEADLSGGGQVSATRSFIRAGGLYRAENGASAGVLISYGQVDYDFEGAVGVQPWGDVRDIRVSAPLRFPVGERASLFVSPQVRWNHEKGASASDGRTWGMFAGMAWQVNDRLRIGPAFGAFSELGDSGAKVFPALLIDWQMADRWSLSTGGGLGATQGPGLTLSYAVSDALSLSFGARSENVRFRLDGTGPAPGGVGEEKSIPVVLSLDYAPNPGTRLTVFAGAELDGELVLENAAGAEISRQSYGAAPVAGFAFRVRF